MGLEEIKRELLSSAKSKADAIIAEAKKSEEEIVRKAKEKIKAMERHYNEELEKLRDAMEIREIASAKLETKRKLLELKKDMVDKAFEKAIETIKNLSKKDKSDIIEWLMKKARNEITIGRVYCNKKDKGILNSSVEIKDADIIGGIIVENKDETVQINLSFDAILNNIKEKYLTEISKILFET